MTASNIEVYNGTFSGAALPKYVSDPIIRPGTKFLFDFTDPDCNAYADGALATGSTFTDLVSGITATLTGSRVANATGKGGLAVSGSASACYLTIGSAGQFDMATTNPVFEVGIHLKQPSSGFNATAYDPLFGLSPGVNSAANGNASQWWWDRGSDGKTFRFEIGRGSSNFNIQTASGAGLGSPAQYAGSYDPTNGPHIAIVNGAQANSGNPGAGALLDGSAMTAQLRLTNFIGTIYRIWVTDITASLAAEVAGNYPASEQLAALPYAQRDWAFVTNTLTGAPKTVFT